MGRKRVIRTPEEEEEFRRIKRNKRAASQQKRRSNAMQTRTNARDEQPVEIQYNPLNVTSSNMMETRLFRTSGTPVGTVTTDSTNRVEVIREVGAPEPTIVSLCTSDSTPQIERCPRIVSASRNTIVTTGQSTVVVPFERVPGLQEELVVTDNSDTQEANNTLSNAQRQHSYRARQRIHGERNVLPAGQINDIQEHYGGGMTEFCTHCNASHFKSEKISNMKNSFHDCCSHGKIRIEPLPKMPDELHSLFDGTHEKSNTFFERIRNYNASFSFASFNANLVNFEGRRPGPYCFKIQGQIYYQVNTAICPAPGELPTYGQLFIVDSHEAVDSLQRRNTALDRGILGAIDRIMRENNVFAQSYQMMGEELQAQQANQSDEAQPPAELQLLFTLKPGMDRRRFNFQRSNEVAAVFSITADGEIPESYVTICNKNTRRLQSVSTMDPNVEPWVYPLFYPFGTRGWHRDLRQTGNNAKRVSREAYTKYQMAIRQNDQGNVILLGRRLFQQWVVDNYVKIEKDRIEFIKANQVKIRAESYSGLVDHLQTTAQNTDARVGKIVILPSSFGGSPRNMMQHYQDAMAIVRKFGKPDLFITMTCNPNWREIKENLFPGQQSSDRPDLTARVFDLKKKHLLDLIVRKKMFGEVQAYVYTIESQKRGLLHIHLLVILKQKLSTPEMVDRCISAEIPDPELHPELHRIVMANMIHGPCGAWCEVNGKCSKHFPKPFRDETTMDADAYPLYRRRETGALYERRGGHVVDNRWVVPYCPTLSRIFNSHINVEIVTSVTAPKYLFKYIFKGPDAAAIQITNTENGDIEEYVINHDEIKDHLEARYVGPNEAVWRICEKKMQEKSHPVLRLPVHLPNEQSVTIPTDMNDDGIRNAMSRVSMLNDYFALNVRDESARQYAYPDIPSHYVFKRINVEGQTVSRWEKRQRRHDAFGRMYSVSPAQTELFHLRLLLLKVKGATSFQNLRTVDGQVCESFIATCLALGLIEDDDEWRKAMEEAAIWMMPGLLRRLFVRILVHCQPIYPEELWEEFKDKLSEDYARRQGMQQAQRKAYSQIARMLINEGSSLSRFPAMEQMEISDEDELDPMIDQLTEIGMQQYRQLNNTQKVFVDAILSAIDNENDEHTCFYVDGPGGSGKTFAYTTLSNLIRGRRKCVSAMAFTGIAAILLPEGKTVHKTFGLPVPLYADSTSSIKVQSKQGKYLKNVDLFIWDEAPMAPRHALEVVDRTLQDIMNNNKPFGGKVIILGGDFRQLLPVKVRSTRSETVNLSIKYSALWPHFSKYALTENMRVLPNEVEFAKFLLDVGDGLLNDPDDNLKVPDRCMAPADRDIVEDTYGQFVRARRFKDVAKCAILSARNVDVEEINSRVMDLYDETSERLYTSVDSTENCGDNDQINETILPEYLNTLSPPSLPPHELRLRKYGIIMLIRNLSINEGLCNGTRLLILELGNTVLRCEILSGDKSGDLVFLHRITLYCENDYPFTFKRRQFPVKIAFAMTINKSQGQTFERISIDLRRDVFNHGQLYVAFSRVRSWEALKVYIGVQRDGNVVKNYVYKELYR